MIEITITLVSGKEIKLTKEEFEELKNQLSEKIYIPYRPIPVNPYPYNPWPTWPHITYEFHETTCI